MMHLAVLLLVISYHGTNAVTRACPYKPADIVFVVDGSGSEGLANFQKQLAFIQNFTGQFEIGKNQTQVSLVTFSTDVTNEFNLNSYARKVDVLSAIGRTNYPNGETHTHLALDYVRLHSLTPQNGSRTNVNKIVIVLTDGKSNEEALTVQAASLLKLRRDVSVIAIGIGNAVDPRELLAIASNKNHTFTVTSFDLLETIHQDLTDTTCHTCGQGPADIFFLLDSSGSEGSVNFRKQLEFVNTVANEFDFGPDTTQMGLATFATGVSLEIPITRYHTKSEFMQNVLRVLFRDGESNLHLGLELTRTQLSDKILTVKSHRFAIILTDGRSLEHERTVEEARKLHMNGVETFVIGIGNDVDDMELRDVASDRSHVFRVNTFDQLDNIHQQIVDRICAEKTVFPTTTTTTPKPTTHTTMSPTTTKPTTTTHKPTTHTTMGTTTTTKPACGPKVADILFVLDSSDSEGPENFKKILDFVYNFARQFAIGVNNVLFSLITYSSSVNVRFYFNTYTSRNNVLNAIQNTSYIGLGTNTSDALHVARTEIFQTQHGSRPNATNIVIVITDGRSRNPNATVVEATLLKKTAEVFSIGIGPEVDQHELSAIASKPSYVMQVNSFELLHTIEGKITEAACSGRI
ncbi:hypothetical protein CHS0354_014020 [Potamilus streckersoni]|uniref:VWFA domain-containing protein n=1 Tax=Potamilus streckersoni TaxID=2493646 RepID=A0AAE0TKA2_9BIVA|nr:hypothetical protein CHS0354_014020 [Potamilus streckersoni]